MTPPLHYRLRAAGAARRRCRRPEPMRTIVHLSDIHFGRVDPRLVAPLVAAIHEIAPDLVAVSGDLTQRARRASSGRRARSSISSPARCWSSRATTTCRCSTCRRGS